MRKKYGNKKCSLFGEDFDSKGEMNRFVFLMHEQREGRITELKRQVKFDVHAKNEAKLFSYVADFTYKVTASGETVVEDFKSEATAMNAVFRLKFRALREALGIEIRIVKSISEPVHVIKENPTKRKRAARKK